MYKLMGFKVTEEKFQKFNLETLDINARSSCTYPKLGNYNILSQRIPAVLKFMVIKVMNVLAAPTLQ